MEQIVLCIVLVLIGIIEWVVITKERSRSNGVCVGVVDGVVVVLLVGTRRVLMAVWALVLAHVGPCHVWRERHVMSKDAQLLEGFRGIHFTSLRRRV